MEIEFDDPDLEEMAFDPKYIGRYPQSIVRAYRRCLRYLMDAPDRRAIYNFPGFHFKKLTGDLSGLCQLRLNDQYRLRIRFMKQEDAREKICVVYVGDDH